MKEIVDARILSVLVEKIQKVVSKETRGCGDRLTIKIAPFVFTKPEERVALSEAYLYGPTLGTIFDFGGKKGSLFRLFIFLLALNRIIVWLIISPLPMR
nr:hypothetical protein [Desulfobacterales bacterium]